MKLFPHQQEALNRTAGKNRVAYFHDMGTGKTYTGSEKLRELGSRVNLIVCQKSKVEDWVDHMVMNYTNNHCWMIYDLTNKNELAWFLRAVSDSDPTPIVGVINFDLIWRRKELANLNNFTLVLDESSLIQNGKSNRAKFIMKMNPKNVILLSGTPCSGKYENLFTQIRLLGWNISEKLYNSQYVNWKKLFVGGMYINVVDKKDPYKNVERLKQKMREHGCDFLKTEEVFDLPEQNFIPVKVPVTKEYKKFKRDRLITVDGIELVGDSTLSFRLYQRQLCTAYNPHKVQAFRDLLESTNDRLIVFYCFNCELEQLKSVCSDLGKPISMINGTVKDLTAYERESNSVTLCQYQSAAKGLNLQKANKIIYFSLTESVEDWMQSLKRVHRIGQNMPCFYYVLTCENSIEEQIRYCLDRGIDFTDELFFEGV